MAGIRGRDDAVDLHRAVGRDRNFGAGGDVAGEGLAMGQAPEHALGCGRAPARLVRHGLQHGPAFRMVLYVLQTERERVLAGDMGQFVHEAFQVDNVLVGVDPAPEARAQVRVAHGVVDLEGGEAVADGMIALGCEALEGDRIHPGLEPPRHDAGQDRLSRDAHPQARDFALVIEPRGHPALRHRVIGAVGHILFPGPQQLHRRARHLPGDEDRLAHVVVDRPGPPPPEAAAQQRFVDVAFVGGQARRFRRGVERRFPVLGRAPDLAAVRRPQGRGVHGLHGRVVLERIGIGRLHLLDRPGDGRLGVADLVGDEGLLGVQALRHHGLDVGAVDLGVRSFVPFDGQGIDRRLGLPPFVGDHGDGVVADGHHLLHPGHGRDLGRIEGFQLGPE